MNSAPLSIAIVGCGKFAEEHVKEIQKIPGTRILAVCDKEELMAQQLAERYGISRQYTSLTAMYEDITPDVVHVTTPPQTHLQIGRYACEKGSHIYVEKPFTTNYGEAVQLIEVATAHGRKVTVGHIYHFYPPALQMRKLVEEGILGEPVHIEAIMGYSLESSFAEAFMNSANHWIYDLPGKLFQNIISHLVYKVLEFMPDETPSVQVYGALRNESLREKHVDILDELRVILAGKDTTAYLTFSANLSPVYSLLRVYGTKNTVEVDFNSRNVIVRRGKQLPTAVGKLLTGFDLARQHQRCACQNLMSFLKSDYHFMAGMNYLISSFYTSIRNDSAPPIPYSDILRTARIMDLIFGRLSRNKGGE